MIRHPLDTVARCTWRQPVHGLVHAARASGLLLRRVSTTVLRVPPRHFLRTLVPSIHFLLGAWTAHRAFAREGRGRETASWRLVPLIGALDTYTFHGG